MYIWYFTLNYSQFLTENFNFFGTPSWKCFYKFSACYLSLKERIRIRAFLWKNEPRRTSTLYIIWWHSANMDVLPGRFQPYGPLWLLIVPYGFLWSLVGSYGPAWSHMILLRPAWSHMSRISETSPQKYIRNSILCSELSQFSMKTNLKTLEIL